MNRLLIAIALLTTVTGPLRSTHAQHMGDMLIGASAAGGGVLTLAYDFSRRVRVTESASGGGNTLYTTTDPGWDLLRTPSGGAHPLVRGIPVSVTITALDPGVSLKIGATTLSTVGQSKLLGTSPSIHVHPSWQMVLPTGLQAERTVSFRLTTTATGYSQSVEYTAILSNTTTTVATTSTTSSTAPMTTTTTGVSSTTSSPATSTTSSSSTTTLPELTIELRAAKTLILSERSGRPERRGLTLVSKDQALGVGRGNGSVDDPTIAGGTLRVATAGGDAFDAMYPLPVNGWTLIGKPGENRGYRYRDEHRLHGPITAVALKPGKQLRVTGRGAALGHTLSADPNPVAVELTIGAHRYCVALGGTTKFRPGRLFKAAHSPPPVACAP